MSTIFTLLMAILGGSLRMLSVCVPLSASFVVRGCQSSVLVTSRLGLVKVESDFERCLNLELPESLTLSLLERSDISAASTLALECFYQPRLKINFDEFVVDSWEYSFWKKCLQTYNTVDKFDAWCGNYIGFLSRCNSRLDRPLLDLSRESILLCATKQSDHDSELIGLLELCLEEPTGRLTTSVANPFREKDANNEHEKPYLCNLCVSRSHRRSGVGKILCQYAESIASHLWGYSEMYIHVEASNYAASSLYKDLGYVPVTNAPSYPLDGILFYRKSLIP